MGYKIQYGPELKTEIKSRAFWKKHWKAAALLTTTAAALILVSLGEWDLFLPGDADVTHRALTELTENIRGGESFSDAITAFCLEIIEGAELP